MSSVLCPEGCCCEGRSLDLTAGLVTELWGLSVKSNHVCVCVCVLSPVQLFKTPWTVACQAPLSIEFFRQEYWSGLPCPPLGDLPNLGIEHPSLMSPALADGFLTASAT